MPGFAKPRRSGYTSVEAGTIPCLCRGIIPVLPGPAKGLQGDRCRGFDPPGEAGSSTSADADLVAPVWLTHPVTATDPMPPLRLNRLSVVTPLPSLSAARRLLSRRLRGWCLDRWQGWISCSLRRRVAILFGPAVREGPTDCRAGDESGP